MAEEERERRKTHSLMPRRLSGRHGEVVPAWPAGGYPRESSPRHHREHCTTGVYTHTMISSRKHHRNQGEAGEESRSVATERRFPERDPASDLLREEAADETIWWRWKRAQRRATRPRWQRRNSPKSAGIARRWRGD
jgi:hypothetical protein